MGPEEDSAEKTSRYAKLGLRWGRLSMTVGDAAGSRRIRGESRAGRGYRETAQ